jgi:hypothetical protein
MAQSIKRFAETVSCFCFNADKSKLALCPNNNEIHIYKKQGAEWAVEVVLTEVWLLAPRLACLSLFLLVVLARRPRLCSQRLAGQQPHVRPPTHHRHTDRAHETTAQ